MSDLVLTTRLTVLKKNLEQVSGLLANVGAREREILSLRQHLLDHEGIKDRTLQIAEGLGFAKVSLESAAMRLDNPEVLSEKIDSAKEKVQSALADLETVIARIEECKADFTEILNRRVKLVEPGVEDADFTAKALRDNLDEQLAGKAQERITEVDRIATRLAKATSPASLQKVWKEYWNNVSAPSEPLFMEYVDLLRGLALRETGLDLGICRIADEILIGFDKKVIWNWKSLTIPARRERMKMTEAQIIRLGFPEWTIWAVPLAAHAFGHIVAELVVEEKTAPELLTRSRHRKVRSHVENCFADAFAAYTMGPAYACAALLLRFDPRQPTRKNERFADAERAFVILEVLKSTGEETGLASTFESTRELLQREWTAALRQTGSAELSTAKERELHAWIEEFVEFLEIKAILAAYKAESWRNAKSWMDKLCEQAPPGDPGADELPPAEDLRDLLNAAWVCRVNHPKQADEIRNKAERLWQDALRRPKRTGPRGAPHAPLGFEKRA